jgi:hypothetical protein
MMPNIASPAPNPAADRQSCAMWIETHDILSAHYPELAKFALQKAVEKFNEAQRRECLEKELEQHERN